LVCEKDKEILMSLRCDLKKLKEKTSKLVEKSQNIKNLIIEVSVEIKELYIIAENGVDEEFSHCLLKLLRSGVFNNGSLICEKNKNTINLKKR